MENATKALIIAGAVLVAILLISVGILLVNNGKGLTDSAGTTANELNATASNRVTAINSALNNLKK